MVRKSNVFTLTDNWLWCAKLCGMLFGQSGNVKVLHKRDPCEILVLTIYSKQIGNTEHRFQNVGVNKGHRLSHNVVSFVLKSENTTVF